MSEKKKIAVFASGSGSNFEAIAQACLKERINGEVVICVCDHPGAYVTERAKRMEIPVLEIRPKSYPSKAEYEKAVLEQLQEKGVEFICLAGYMRIIGDVLLEAYNGRIINIHPSLLPAFPGVDAIGQALSYGVKVFGITIHYVDHTLDGGKIISQASVAYDGNDRDELEAIIHPMEHALYVSTLNKLFSKDF